MSPEAASVGATASCLFTPERVLEFASSAGDHNRIHLDDDFARSKGFSGALAHGPLGIIEILRLARRCGVQVAGRLWEAKYVSPMHIGETINFVWDVQTSTGSARAASANVPSIILSNTSTDWRNAFGDDAASAWTRALDLAAPPGNFRFRALPSDRPLEDDDSRDLIGLDQLSPGWFGAPFGIVPSPPLMCSFNGDGSPQVLVPELALLAGVTRQVLGDRFRLRQGGVLTKQVFGLDEREGSALATLLACPVIAEPYLRKNRLVNVLRMLLFDLGGEFRGMIENHLFYPGTR